MSEEYKSIVNNKAILVEDILQLESSSEISERHSTILECQNEDDHEMLKNIEKICEEDYLIKESKNPIFTSVPNMTELSIGKTKKKNKMYQEPISERKMKKGEKFTAKKKFDLH